MSPRLPCLLLPALLLATSIYAQPDPVLLVDHNALLQISAGSTLTVAGGTTRFAPGSTVMNEGLLRSNGPVHLEGEYTTTIAGSLPGTEFGQVRTTDNYEVAGTLYADLLADYRPAGVVRLDLFLGDAGSGTFTEAFLPPGGWMLDYTSSEIVLTNAPALPVTWLAFTGQVTAGGVQLAWTTAREERSAYFGVERREASGRWWEIGRVTAAGFSADTSHYAFLDPAPGPTDPVLYRLRQVDADGTTDYSKIVAVDGAAAAELALYPNPAAEGIYLTGMTGNRAYRITDVGGRILLQGTLDEGPRPYIALPEALPPGLYFLRLGAGQVLRFSRLR